VAGPLAETRITWQPDPVIERIVRGWRARVRPEKAQRLGFATDASFEDTVRWFLEDDILSPS
ncbi:MAG: NAD-dependent dehydratase, partial [Rhodobacter sp.]|nr:NAD-dependent dehydratase [Rhodobacter sp.]